MSGQRRRNRLMLPSMRRPLSSGEVERLSNHCQQGGFSGPRLPSLRVFNRRLRLQPIGSRGPQLPARSRRAGGARIRIHDRPRRLHHVWRANGVASPHASPSSRRTRPSVHPCPAVPSTRLSSMGSPTMLFLTLHLAPAQSRPAGSSGTARVACGRRQLWAHNRRRRLELTHFSHLEALARAA